MKWIIVVFLLLVMFSGSSAAWQPHWPFAGGGVFEVIIGTMAAIGGLILSVFGTLLAFFILLAVAAVAGLGLPVVVLALALCLLVGPIIVPLLLIAALMAIALKASCVSI